MRVNNTSTVYLRSPVPTSTGVLSAVNLQIKRPDGVVNNVAGTVSSDNSLSAVYTPVIAGRHVCLWTATLNTAQVSFSENFWVVWTNVYEVIGSLIGLEITSIPFRKLDIAFQSFVTEVQSFAPAIGQYYNLSTREAQLASGEVIAYSDGFDQGAAYIIAARIRPYIGGKRPTGEVQILKKGTTTIQYTSSSPMMPQSLEQLWEEQGWAILTANIPEIRYAYARNRTGDEIMTRGPMAPGNFHKRLEDFRQEVERSEGFFEFSMDAIDVIGEV